MKKGNMGKKGDTTEHQMGKAAQYKLWKRILSSLNLSEVTQPWRAQKYNAVYQDKKVVTKNLFSSFFKYNINFPSP